MPQALAAKSIVAAILASLLLAPGTARAQSGHVEQIGAGSEPSVGVGQIPGAVADSRSEPAPQLSRDEDSRRTTPQLTRERGAAPAPAQLYRGGRTAQPADPLSSPSEGRTAAVAPVEGRDRCDPAARGEAATQDCERVIETRAAEFEREEPALSAEQRLLMEQRLREQASAAAAARRLAANTGDPGSADEQGIASIVLRGARPPLPPAEEPLPEEALAVIEAIVGGMTGVPPQR